MLFVTIRSIMFGLGLLCLHVDIGSRLFGSYVRTTQGMLCRMSIVIFAEIIYSLPLLSIIIIPDNNWVIFLNTLIFILGISTITIFLFPPHFGIRSCKHLHINKAQDQELTSSVILHEESIQIDHPNCNSSLQLLVLSDLHCNTQDQFEAIQESLNKPNMYKFDMVFVLGDLTEKEEYLHPLFKLFNDIDSKYGLFLVRGNHDYEGGRENIIEQLAQEFEIILLNDKSIYIDEMEISLIGTEKPWNKTAMTIKPSGFSIGLSHTPDNLKLFSRLNTSLVLVGHTHGGKIQIPLIGSILVPSLYGRFLDYGWFKYRETLMFITKGYGYFLGKNDDKGEILKLSINGKPDSIGSN